MLTINVVLNLILLPTYGAVATGWATLTSFIVGALSSWILGRSLLTLPNLKKDFSSSSVATAIMLLVLNIMPSVFGTTWLSSNMQYFSVLCHLCTFGVGA